MPFISFIIASIGLICMRIMEKQKIQLWPLMKTEAKVCASMINGCEQYGWHSCKTNIYQSRWNIIIDVHGQGDQRYKYARQFKQSEQLASMHHTCAVGVMGTDTTPTSITILYSVFVVCAHAQAIVLCMQNSPNMRRKIFI